MNENDTVLIYLKFPIGKLDNPKALNAVYDLEDILFKIVEDNKIGRFDGNEFCDGPNDESVTFFIYGDDADKISDIILPIVSKLPVLSGSHILKKYGTVEKILMLKR